MQEEFGDITIKNDNVTDILAHDIPYKLGKYEIKGELGRGTCGIVYKGFDPFIRRDVAIKVGWTESVETMPSGTSLSNQDVFNEAHAASKLQHPNIVALYDAQTEKELSYIIMEYIEGETLMEYCRNDEKRLATEKVLEIMFKCCMALDFSHQAGVIHRDIKPSNIMLTKDGETKIMDFSVAEVSQSRQVKSELIVGSPNYMSPEQVQRQTVGPTSDLYSLATVMFQLLTGKTLYPKGSVKQIFSDILNTPAPKLKNHRPELPEALSDIIEKALNKDPSKRYQSGKEMAAEITAVYDSLSFAGSSVNTGEERSALMKLPFFKLFNNSQIEELMTVCTVLKFNQGQIISKEGDIDESFYLIIHGSADVIKEGKTITQINQSDCFGDVPIQQGGTNQTTIQAATSGVYTLKVNSTRVDTLSKDTQILFYKAFTFDLISRLAGQPSE